MTVDQPTAAGRAGRPSGLRVLIVEDDADTSRALKLLLKMEGHEARVAPDGPEALDAAAAHAPEVVLLDLTLPTLGGLEVARLLREAPGGSALILVAVSGYGRETIPDPSPFDQHLTKPIDPDRLLKLLADLAGGRAGP